MTQIIVDDSTASDALEKYCVAVYQICDKYTPKSIVVEKSPEHPYVTVQYLDMCANRDQLMKMSRAVPSYPFI